MASSGRLVPRVLGELSVIVLGVLIALWVDGWVEARSEREAREFLLVSLVDEMEANILALDSAVSQGGETLSGMRTLLEMSHALRPVPDGDSLRALLVGATSYWRSGHFGVAFDAYDAVVATGSADLLPDRELGLRLAKHRAEIRSGQGDESYAERAFEDVLDVIREHGGWYSVVGVPELDRLSVPRPTAAADFDGLLADPAFSEALFSRILWETNIVNFYAEQAQELTTTLELLLQQSQEGR